MSTAERLALKINKAQSTYIRVSEVPASQQIDIDGLRALSYEMRDHIGRNIAARNASVRSAAGFTTR